jgi:hypothetical protein
LKHATRPEAEQLPANETPELSAKPWAAIRMRTRPCSCFLIRWLPAAWAAHRRESDYLPNKR